MLKVTNGFGGASRILFQNPAILHTSQFMQTNGECCLESVGGGCNFLSPPPAANGSWLRIRSLSGSATTVAACESNCKCAQERTRRQAGRYPTLSLCLAPLPPPQPPLLMLFSTHNLPLTQAAQVVAALANAPFAKCTILCDFFFRLTHEAADVVVVLYPSSRLLLDERAACLAESGLQAESQKFLSFCFHAGAGIAAHLSCRQIDELNGQASDRDTCCPFRATTAAATTATVYVEFASVWLSLAFICSHWRWRR